MKKLSLALFSLLILSSSCMTLRSRDYYTPHSIPERLPRLGVQVHERSFIDAFDLAVGRENVLPNIVLGGDNTSPWEDYQVTDQALQDVFRLFQQEVFNNMTVGEGPRYGNARFKLMFYDRKNSGWGYWFPSVATGFAANVFGMPYKVFRAELDLQMEITDANGKVLGRYTASGTGKARVALYTGYVKSDAKRKANLLALQDAVNKIKLKLEADVPDISESLQVAGVLPKKDR